MSRKETLGGNPADQEKEVKNLRIRRELSATLRESRLARRLGNVFFRLSMLPTLLLTEEGRELFNDPEMRRFFYDKEARVGLLEDSIISDELYVPNMDGTSLEHKSTVAGRFVSFDFHRPEEFKSVAKNRARQNDHGKLMVFALDEVKYNGKNDYTPTDLLNPFDLLHALSIDAISPEEAIRQGFLIETTYREAYGKVGLFNKYKICLDLQGLSDKSIYAVTPKGNTLIGLIKDAGEKKKDPKGIYELKPAFSPMPI